MPDTRGAGLAPKYAQVVQKRPAGWWLRSIIIIWVVVVNVHAPNEVVE